MDFWHKACKIWDEKGVLTFCSHVALPRSYMVVWFADEYLFSDIDLCRLDVHDFT